MCVLEKNENLKLISVIVHIKIDIKHLNKLLRENDKVKATNEIEKTPLSCCFQKAFKN